MKNQYGRRKNTTSVTLNLPVNILIFFSLSWLTRRSELEDGVSLMDSLEFSLFFGCVIARLRVFEVVGVIVLRRHSLFSII